MSTKNQTDANGNILVGAGVALGPEIIEIPASFADFALAAGLPHDACKSDVLAAMGKSKAEHAKLLGEIGAESVDKALGKITAERDTHGKLVKAIVGDDAKNPTTEDAIAKLAADRKKADRVKAEQLLGEAKAEGKTAGDKAMGIFDKFGMEAFQAHLDTLTPNAALVGTPPQMKSSETPTQPSGGAAGPKVEVKLTRADEKRIKASGRSREEFIEARRDELANAAAMAADDADDDDQ